MCCKDKDEEEGHRRISLKGKKSSDNTASQDRSCTCTRLSHTVSQYKCGHLPAYNYFLPDNPVARHKPVERIQFPRTSAQGDERRALMFDWDYQMFALHERARSAICSNNSSKGVAMCMCLYLLLTASACPCVVERSARRTGRATPARSSARMCECTPVLPPSVLLQATYEPNDIHRLAGGRESPVSRLFTRVLSVLMAMDVLYTGETCEICAPPMEKTEQFLKRQVRLM